jgi:phasin family protein
MTDTAEQFMATSKANVEALQGLGIHALTGFQKLVELNLAASKANVFEAFSYTQAVLDAKDAQQLLALQAALFQPWIMEYVSYRSQAYTIAAETGDGIIKAFATVVENVEKTIPGTEAAVAVLKSAVSASHKAIKTANDTARKAVKLAESNLESVSTQADTGTKASRKR